jgi:signal transduction histidine kinase
VRISDNGSGIPEDKIGRIFNPFFTTKEKGTGLGMAISRKIVEAHEGTIEVASEVGRGTEFTIRLPLPAKG